MNDKIIIYDGKPCVLLRAVRLPISGAEYYSVIFNNKNILLYLHKRFGLVKSQYYNSLSELIHINEKFEEINK